MRFFFFLRSLVPPLALPAERPIADESLNSSIPKKKVALVELCYGRSGDKGDASNIGIFARHERYYPFLARVLTEEAVRKYMEHLVKGKVTRFAVPGIRGFNFVLTRALGGGGITEKKKRKPRKLFLFSSLLLLFSHLLLF